MCVKDSQNNTGFQLDPHSSWPVSSDKCCACAEPG